MKSAYISRFTPRAMSHEDLEAMFVQRHKLAEYLVEMIRDSAETENKHFRLLIGPRGIGKTHLLALVYHRVAKLDDLHDKLLIAWLREEEWGVDSFLDLLLRILRALGEKYPQEYRAKLQDSVEELAKIYQDSPDEALFRAEALLREFADGRSLLLLMENLDDIFNGLGDIGQKQLRGYINNYSFLTILATAQSLFNAVKLKDNPFYGFFCPHDLKELQPEEAVSLLKNLAKLQGNQDLESFLQTPLGRSRIQAVHHLAGGNPRIYIVFSEFLSRESLDNLVDHFMRALDDLTPYYQQRMAALSPEQRKIVEFLSDARQAVPRLEIAQGCFLPPETAFSQLEDLYGKGYVMPASQFGEEFYNEFYYELREPLMRFCLEVKKQRGEPIKLFLDFLRIWYSPAELRQRLTVLPADAKLEREYVMRALKDIGDIGDRKDNSNVGDIGDIGDLRDGSNVGDIGDRTGRDNKYQEPLPSFKLLNLAALPLSFLFTNARCWFWDKQAYMLGELNHDEEGLAYCDKAIELDPDYAQIWACRGWLLDSLKRYEEALVSYDRSVKLNPNNAKTWGNRSLSLEELERYEEALASVDKATELKPKHAWAWAQRGDLLDKLELYEEALASYDKAIELRSNDPWTWASRRHLLKFSQWHEKAVASYDKAIELNSKFAWVWPLISAALINLKRFGSHYAWAWANRGWSLERLERYEEALASYDKAIETDSNYAWAWARRGYSLNRLERYEEALASYDKAIDVDSNPAWYWANRGDVLDKLERHEEALASYDKIIEANPNDAWAWAHRGDMLDKLERYEEALASYDRAIKLDPNYAWAWANRGYSLNRLERHEEALVSYDKAAELDPNYAWAWAQRGYLLNELKRYEEALTSYDKAVELSPNYAWAWTQRGKTLGALERYEETLASYDRAIEIDPNYAWAWAVRGNMLDGLERHEEALTSYNKAIEVDPNYAWAWANRGFVFFKLNRYEEALASYEKALEINPNFPGAWALRGEVLDNLERYEEALAFFDKAIEVDPNYTWAWANRGDALYDLKRYEEALASFDKVIELDPNDKRAWFSRGWLLDNMGRYEEALAACDKAIALGDDSAAVFFNRAIAILGLKWEQGIVALNDVFLRLKADEQADPDDAKLIIRQLLEQTEDAVIWKTRLSPLIEIYDKHQALSILAQGLARSISSLIPDSGLSPPGRLGQRLRSARTVVGKESPRADTLPLRNSVSDETARAWLETWRELVGDIPEFQISLRLLAAATDYIEKNCDMRVLLALPIEERELLKQILGIGE